MDLAGDEQQQKQPSTNPGPAQDTGYISEGKLGGFALFRFYVKNSNLRLAVKSGRRFVLSMTQSYQTPSAHL